MPALLKICCLFPLLFALPTLVGAQVAYLLSDKIIEGDVAVLVVEYRNNKPSLFSLDTTPLQASFDVLSVKPSVQRVASEKGWVNLMRWEVMLSAKKIGKIEISALRIKEATTPVLSLEVVRFKDSNLDGERVYLQTSVDNDSPYSGEQLVVTARMFHNRNLLGGFIEDPEFEHFDKRRFGRDRRYQQEIDGSLFQVLERRLLLIAQAPGRLVIPAFEFRGEIESLSTAVADRFLANSRLIRRTSKPLVLEVKAVPKLFADKWLPLQALQLSQQWNLPAQPLHVGDTFNRTITINTVGLEAGRFPQGVLTLNAAGFEVYNDKIERSDTFESDAVVGELQLTQVFVLTSAGDLTIADIPINWWDLHKDQAQQTLLAGRQLLVQSPAINSGDDSQSSANGLLPFGLWRYLNDNVIAYLIGIALVVCVVFVGVYLTRRKRLESSGLFKAGQLRKACLAADAKSAGLQLIAYGRQQGMIAVTGGLRQLASSCAEANFGQQLRRLDEVLYAASAPDWDGHQLWIVFHRFDQRRVRQTRPNDKGLCALYPSSAAPTGYSSPEL